MQISKQKQQYRDSLLSLCAAVFYLFIAAKLHQIPIRISQINGSHTAPDTGARHNARFLRQPLAGQILHKGIQVFVKLKAEIRTARLHMGGVGRQLSPPYVNINLKVPGEKLISAAGIP